MPNQTTTWEPVGDDIWTLPAKTIYTPTGDITITAIWTDTDGLQIAPQFPDDMFPATYVGEIAAAMFDLQTKGQHGPHGGNS